MNKKNEIDLIILAGGAGTRVKDITENKIQKVMLPINDIPFLAYLIKLYTKKGYRNIIIAAGHNSEGIKKYFENNEITGANILYSEESTPLGTAGAIRFALSYSKTKNALVINGDTVFDIDLEKLKEQHLKSGAVFTIALKNNKENSKYGVVELNKNNDIIKFQEKTQSSGLINGGIYFVNKEKFEKIVDNKFGKRPLSLEKDVFPYLATKRSLKGVVLTGTFIDIGTPDSYKEATKILKK